MKKLLVIGLILLLLAGWYYFYIDQSTEKETPSENQTVITWSITTWNFIDLDANSWDIATWNLTTWSDIIWNLGTWIDLQNEMENNDPQNEVNTELKKYENDFFVFFSDLGIEVMWPQDIPYQSLFHTDPEFVINDVPFIFSVQDGLFFNDPFGTQWWIKIDFDNLPSTSNSNQQMMDIIQNIWHTIEFKIDDLEEYKQTLAVEYPDFIYDEMEADNNIDDQQIDVVYLDWVIVEWIDAATAQRINYDNWLATWYIKDETQVFRGPQKIQWADPDSFQVIDERFSKDKNNVYFDREIIEWADSDSFVTEYVESYNYVGKDKNFVYILDKKNDNVRKLDAKNLEFFRNNYLMVKDENDIYNSDGGIFAVPGVNINLETFEIIPNNKWMTDHSKYAIDKDNLYYLVNSMFVSWVDWDSFEYFETYQKHLIKKCWEVSYTATYDAKDENSFYYHWEKLDTDPDNIDC